LCVGEEASWRALSRKLPASADAFLAAARDAEVTAAEEAMIHLMLARAYRSLERFEDAYRHAEAALGMIPPSIDASPDELELRRLCSEVALRSGRIERSESHAVRLGLAAAANAPGGRRALADALDRLIEASRWRGAVFEAIAVGPAMRAVAIEDGSRIFAPRPLIRYAALLIDGGQFVPALRILDEVDIALPDAGADRERGLALLARTRASRRMGNPKGARKQMREARKFIQLLDDRELFARLAMEEVLTRIERTPPEPDEAAKWVQKYLERRRDDMEPDEIWDRRLWTMLGVARDFAGDREGALKAWQTGIVGHEREGPLSMTEARGYLMCATYLHEDRQDAAAAAIARRGDQFLAQFARAKHGRAGLTYAGELRRSLAQSMGQDAVADDFARRDASGDVIAERHIEAAKKAEAEERLDEAEKLFLRAFDCAPWSEKVAQESLWFLLRKRRAKPMRELSDAARVAGHSGVALFAGGLVALGARDADGAVGKLGRLALMSIPAPRSPRLPLGLGAMLVHEPGIALRVLSGDPGWGGGEWEMAPPRRASALKWMAKAYLALGQPAKARRQLRRSEAGGMDLTGVQEIEWEAAYLEGKIGEAYRHVGFVIDRPEAKVKAVPLRFRAVLHMDQGKWPAALADWQATLTDASDSATQFAVWVCARAAGDNDALARCVERCRVSKSRWLPYMTGEVNGAEMQRVLARASLAGETDLAWEFFLLGVARMKDGEKLGASKCFKQAAFRARDDVVVRAASARALKR